MPEVYTDDDVTSVVDLDLLLSREEADLILSAVAPAIAARALRAAADEMLGFAAGWAQPGAVAWLRARAEQVNP